MSLGVLSVGAVFRPALCVALTVWRFVERRSIWLSPTRSVAGVCRRRFSFPTVGRQEWTMTTDGRS